MALLLDIEPPSSSQKDDTNLQKNKKRGKFDAFWAKVWGLLKAPFLILKKDNLRLAFSAIRDLIRGAIDNKFLPHFAVSFIFLVVLIANVNERSQAYAANQELNSIDPIVEKSVAETVDTFTPLILDDGVITDKANTAGGYSGGFATNTAPVDTEITQRVEPLPDNSKGQVNYIVRDGDTLTGLGWKFGVKLATIKFVNNLTSDIIRPGMKLKIPKQGYEVPASQLAARNNATATTSTSAARRSAISRPAGSIKNAYPWGWCTYYVATRRVVPGRWGNAGQWLNSAKSAGYPTGSTPVPGAIVVTRESFWGHVAYVESVNGSQFTVSEMNAPIFGVATRRTMSTSDRVIKGFIY